MKPEIVFEDCTISGNTGAGIVSNVEVTVTNSVIRGNSVGACLVGEGASSRFVGSEIMDNTTGVIALNDLNIFLTTAQVSELLAFKANASDPQDLATRMQSSRVGRFLSRQKAVDWLRLAQEIWKNSGS